MKRIPISTLFVLVAIPFVLITGIMMIQSGPPVGVPSCYKNIICDTAHILTDEQVKQVEEYHQILMDHYDIDLRVLTSNMNAASTFNYFKSADIGNESKAKQGALLMLDPQSALIRFHTSASLRAIYTDQFIAYIEGQQMLPFFQNGQVSAGIVDTSKIIALRAQEAQQGKAFNIADVSTKPVPNQSASSEGATKSSAVQRPAEIVSEYQRMLFAGNASYDLPIYSKASKSLRRNQPLTPQQMKAEIASHTVCEIYKEIILDEGLAVLLYDITQRQCSPYFLVFEDGAWRIDLPSMAKHIRIDPAGEWHLASNQPFIYTNALLDWQFDKNGTPLPMPKMRWGLLIDSDLDAHVTYIKKIYDGTPASEMPLKEKDVILEWDGLKNPIHADVQKSMTDSDPGKKLTVLLWRKGQRLTVEIEAPPRLSQ